VVIGVFIHFSTKKIEVPCGCQEPSWWQKCTPESEANSEKCQEARRVFNTVKNSLSDTYKAVGDEFEKMIDSIEDIPKLRIPRVGDFINEDTVPLSAIPTDGLVLGKIKINGQTPSCDVMEIGKKVTEFATETIPDTYNDVTDKITGAMDDLKAKMGFLNDEPCNESLGYEKDIRDGNCYRCPKNYNRDVISIETFKSPSQTSPSQTSPSQTSPSQTPQIETFVTPTTTCSRFDCEPRDSIEIFEREAGGDIIGGMCYRCPEDYRRTDAAVCGFNMVKGKIPLEKGCQVDTPYACYQPPQTCADVGDGSTPHWDPTAMCPNMFDHSCGRCVNNAANLGCPAGYSRTIGVAINDPTACYKYDPCKPGYKTSIDTSKVSLPTMNPDGSLSMKEVNLPHIKTCSQVCKDGYDDVIIGDLPFCVESGCKTGYKKTVLGCQKEGDIHTATCEFPAKCKTGYVYDAFSRQCYTCGGWDHTASPVVPPWKPGACTTFVDGLPKLAPADDYYDYATCTCKPGFVEVVGLCLPETYLRDVYIKEPSYIPPTHRTTGHATQPQDEKFTKSEVPPYAIPRRVDVDIYNPLFEDAKPWPTPEPVGPTEADLTQDLPERYKTKNCPDNYRLYDIAGGGFCCAGSTTDKDGTVTFKAYEATGCTTPGDVCALDPTNTKNNPVCETSALECPSGYSLYGINKGGFCCNGQIQDKAGSPTDNPLVADQCSTTDVCSLDEDPKNQDNKPLCETAKSVPEDDGYFVPLSDTNTHSFKLVSTGRSGTGLIECKKKCWDNPECQYFNHIPKDTTLTSATKDTCYLFSTGKLYNLKGVDVYAKNPLPAKPCPGGQTLYGVKPDGKTGYCCAGSVTDSQGDPTTNPFKGVKCSAASCQLHGGDGREAETANMCYDPNKCADGYQMEKYDGKCYRCPAGFDRDLISLSQTVSL